MPKGGKVRVFELSEQNKIMLNEFKRSIKNETSWINYRSTICNFMLEVDNIFGVEEIDVEEFLEGCIKLTTMQNKEAHIKSFYRYIINNNICDASEKISRNMLLYLM